MIVHTSTLSTRHLLTFFAALSAAVVLAQAPEAYRDLPPSDTVIATTGSPALPNAGLGDFNDNWYILEALNQGLAPKPDTFFLVSPQETLESYLRACRAGRFETAAHALNLNLFAADRQAGLGPLLAQQLYYVLDQRIGISWGTVPDRPDGAATVPSTEVGTVGAARRSIAVGSLVAGGREIALRLQRVRVGDEAPRWVWAATTVEEIPALYHSYGPGLLEQRVPSWSKTQVLGVPLWVVFGIIVAAGVCFAFGWLVYHGFRWVCKAAPFNWANVLGEQLAKPIGVTAGILLFYALLRDALALSGPLARGFFTLMIVIVVGTVVWVASRAIDYVIDYLAKSNIADVSDEANDDARRQLTMLSVGRRVLVFVLLLVGLSVIFSRINGLEGIGYALIGSAGFMAIVVGIAAQSTLGNLVAGIQIAVTRPVRIGDAVLYEGNWGNVEDVRFTYLLIKTWDLRRVVVPLKYFIDHPFENWSMMDSKLLKTFYVYVDYGIDVNQVRDKFDELTRAHELYNDHKPPDLIVYAIEPERLKLRCTVSAENSSEAWTLHCDVREALNDYIVGLNGGKFLPRERVEVLDR